jgi:hypothetical protein
MRGSKVSRPVGAKYSRTDARYMPSGVAVTGDLLRTAFRFDGEGRITDKGIFHGLPRYVPYFWRQWSVNARCDAYRDADGAVMFEVQAYARKLFPELVQDQLWLVERDGKIVIL